MIEAKVVSLTINEAIGVVKKLDFETYIEEKDSVCLNSLFEAMPWEGLDAVIMTKEEYESLRKRLNEKEGEICKLIVNNDVEQGRLREEIKKLEEVNKALDSVSDVLRKSLLDEREKTRKLKEENEAIQKDIKDLEEKMAQEAAEVDLCPDGTIVFKKKRVSELEKKVKELEEENKYLKKRLMARYTVKLDADGAIIYPELKED